MVGGGDGTPHAFSLGFLLQVRFEVSLLRIKKSANTFVFSR